MKKGIVALLVLFSTNIAATYSQKNVALAKIYPNEYQNNLTHSGEVYDFDKLTAAHPDLQLGTIVRIINPENNKRVLVRINDRISRFLPWQFLLSKSAGENLNITQTNPFDIQLEILKMGSIKPLMTSKGIDQEYLNTQKYRTTIKGNFGIQLGSFSNKKEAIDFIFDLEVKGFTQIYLNENHSISDGYKVLIGPFEQIEGARQTNVTLKSIFNLDGFVIRLN